MSYNKFIVERKVKTPGKSRCWFINNRYDVYEVKSKAKEICKQLRNQNINEEFRVSEVAPYEEIHEIGGGTFFFS